jgi:putative membrane protein
MATMHGYDYGSMWPMGGMMAGWLLLTLLMVGAVVWAVMTYARPRGSAADTGSDTGRARRILAERYAAGELDTEEYTHRLDALR